VIREGTTNVIKHSGAGRCRIDVAHEGGLVTVAVEDDGPGAAAPRRFGNGLIGLLERVEEVGGTLTAGADRPRRGWRLRVEIPSAPSLTESAPPPFATPILAEVAGAR
jgi:two-component system sensor histidine kinase DesK